MNYTTKDIVRFDVSDSVIFKMVADIKDGDEVEKYCPSADDIANACKKMVEIAVDYDVFDMWFKYATEALTDEFCKEAIELDDQNTLGDVLPKSEKELVFSMFAALDALLWISDMAEKEEFLIELQQVAELVDNYAANQGKPYVDWKLTNYQKDEILNYCESVDNDVPDELLDLARKIINEGCEQGSTHAMYIKGYSCFGGDKLFDCDWDMAKSLIEKLFEIEGDPNYANSLGYIYFYGKCNDGKPEYEKAFQYYSVGAAYGVYESIYKLADMFMEGLGTIKSALTAEHMIEQLYDKSYEEFVDGEDANFADIALRKAAIYMGRGMYADAYKTYMMADFAIKQRIENGETDSDRNVAEKISEAMNEAKSHLSDTFFKEKLVTDCPYMVSDFVGSDPCHIALREIKDGVYSLKIMKCDGASPSLLTIPELGFVEFADSFTMKVTSHGEINYMSDDCDTFDDSSEIIIDGVETVFGGSLVFFSGDEAVLTISDAEYEIVKEEL